MQQAMDALSNLSGTCSKSRTK